MATRQNEPLVAGRPTQISVNLMEQITALFVVATECVPIRQNANQRARQVSRCNAEKFSARTPDSPDYYVVFRRLDSRRPRFVCRLLVL